MTNKNKRTITQKISNFLFVIVGLIWIYRGLVNCELPSR